MLSDATQDPKEPDYWSIMLDNEQVGGYQGPVVIGIRPLNTSEYDTYPTGSRQDVFAAGTYNTSLYPDDG